MTKAERIREGMKSPKVQAIVGVMKNSESFPAMYRNFRTLALVFRADGDEQWERNAMQMADEILANKVTPKEREQLLEEREGVE